MMARETKGGYHGYQFNPVRVHRLHCIDCSTKHLGRTERRRIKIRFRF